MFLIDPPHLAAGDRFTSIILAPRKTGTMEDRRSRIRFNVRYPVTITTSRGTMEGETKDMSADGASISCPEPLNPNEPFLLKVEFPTGLSVEVSAEVVWTNIPGPEDEMTARGMGVRFLW